MNNSWLSQRVGYLSALLWVIGSVFLTLGLGKAGIELNSLKKRQKKDHNYLLRGILQTSPQKNGLKSRYLCELIGLSIDKPISLFDFDCELAEKKLIASPLIKSASVKTIKPNTVYVNYEMRTPVALIADYENLAIDQEGFLFPLFPFHPPKKIPSLYLGLPPFGETFEKEVISWNTPLSGKRITLAFDLLKYLQNKRLNATHIDLSNAFAPTLGKREIIVSLDEEEQNPSHIALRLGLKDYPEQLQNYICLRKELMAAPHYLIAETGEEMQIIDLRLSKLAFIEKKVLSQ